MCKKKRLKNLPLFVFPAIFNEIKTYCSDHSIFEDTFENISTSLLDDYAQNAVCNKDCYICLRTKKGLLPILLKRQEKLDRLNVPVKKKGQAKRIRYNKLAVRIGASL